MPRLRLVCLILAALTVSAPSASAQAPSNSISVSSVPSYFAHCAGENGYCTFNGSAAVIFGSANGDQPVAPPAGKFYQQTFSGGASCSHTVFGDPAVGYAKACWIGPIPGTPSGSIQQVGGSVYPFYVQNFGLWDDNQRSVVGLYHLAPTLVEAQLRQMYNSGQHKVALLVEYVPFENSAVFANGIPTLWPDVFGAYLNSSGGQLSPQTQQNVVSLLNLIQTIGFDQVTLRFGPAGVANPALWGFTWNEAQFEQDEAIAFNTRDLAERTLAGSSIKRLYDLGAEEAGIPHNQNADGTYTDGQSRTWTSRMWADYVAKYGSADSYGFSIAYSYGTLTSAIAEFDAAGTRPNTYAFDSWGPSDVWYIYQELLAANEPAKPIIIQETLYNDAGQSAAIANQLVHIPLNIAFIDQYPANSNAPNADGMTPPTNYGAYGGSAATTGTIVGYPCTLAAGQSSCTTQVSWATSNATNVALYVNGVMAVNLPNIVTTLTGSTTITLGPGSTNLVLVSSQGPLSVTQSITALSATSAVLGQLTLSAINTAAPVVTTAGLGGSSYQAIWATGSNFSSNCSVRFYDPNGSPLVPVAISNSVSCGSTSLSFSIPTSVLNTYSAISFTVTNTSGQSSQPFTLQLATAPVLSAAGVGGNPSKLAIWGTGKGFAGGCTVSLYDPNALAAAPVFSSNQVNCSATDLSFLIPTYLQPNFNALYMSITNPSGMSSPALLVPLH